mmetsp:Transcript_47099/g.47936  ORF Transcript_47099/g.47936 Transcript_47099/m.47936 type:complete len:111 (-) Transcript_47099:320-652(-)
MQLDVAENILLTTPLFFFQLETRTDNDKPTHTATCSYIDTSSHPSRNRRKFHPLVRLQWAFPSSPQWHSILEQSLDKMNIRLWLWIIIAVVTTSTHQSKSAKIRLLHLGL